MRPLALAAAIAGVALVILAVILFTLPKKTEVKLELELAKPELGAFEEQEVSVGIRSNRKTSVILVLELRDPNNRVRMAKHETLVVDKSARFVFRFPVPRKAGRYTTKVTARWNGEIAEELATFNVRAPLLEPLLPTIPIPKVPVPEVPPEIPVPEIPEEVPEVIPEEVPEEPVEEIPPEIPPAEVPPEEALTVEAQLEDELRNMADQPVNALVGYCATKPAEQQPTCLELTAIIKDTVDVCDKIDLIAKHDSCYSWFILGQKRFELCPKIKEKGMRNACQLAGIALTTPIPEVE